MEWYTLDDVCDDITVGYVGPTSEYYTDDGIPFLRTQNVGQGKIVRREIKQVTLEFHNKLKKSTLRKGDVILSRVISDKINYAVIPEDLDGANCANVVIVRPGKKLLPEYFAFYISSADVQERLINRSVGSAQSVVNVQVVKDWKIPLPPLTEQKRIASLLARADRLRQLRRTAHDLGDALLQSVFLEMSEKARGKMKEVRLETLADVKTGGTPSREVSEYFNGQIPWVKTTEVVNEVIYETSEKISEAGLKASNCEVFPVGTILIAMYGQGLTRGRTGKLGIPATTNQACAAILPSSKINTDYLWTFLKLSYNEIRELGRGGNQPNLNLSMVRDLVIPVPPLSLQEEFAGVVARVESLRGRMGESTRQVEGLFESLLAEAFNA